MALWGFYSGAFLFSFKALSQIYSEQITRRRIGPAGNAGFIEENYEGKSYSTFIEANTKEKRRRIQAKLVLLLLFGSSAIDVYS